MVNEKNPARTLYFTDEHEMFRKSVCAFVEKEINPHTDEWMVREAPSRR